MYCSYSAQHHIERSNADAKPYKVSPEEQLNEMLQESLIRPPLSPYQSPIVLVQKKGKKDKRRCSVDYRKLNAVTKKWNSPLSNIEEILTYFEISSLLVSEKLGNLNDYCF